MRDTDFVFRVFDYDPSAPSGFRRKFVLYVGGAIRDPCMIAIMPLHIAFSFSLFSLLRILHGIAHGIVARYAQWVSRLKIPRDIYIYIYIYIYICIYTRTYAIARYVILERRRCTERTRSETNNAVCLIHVHTFRLSLHYVAKPEPIAGLSYTGSYKLHFLDAGMINRAPSELAA